MNSAAERTVVAIREARHDNWPLPLFYSAGAHIILLALLIVNMPAENQKERHTSSVIGVTMLTSVSKQKPQDIAKPQTVKQKKLPLEQRPAVRPLTIPEIAPVTKAVAPTADDTMLSTAAQAAELTPVGKKPSYFPQDVKAESENQTSNLYAKVKRRTEQAALEKKKQHQVDWISMFPSMVASKIQSQLPSEMSALGMRCELKIKLTADGTLIDVEDDGGDDVLCVAAKNVLYRIGKFEIPENIPDSAYALKTLSVSIR